MPFTTQDCPGLATELDSGPRVSRALYVSMPLLFTGRVNVILELMTEIRILNLTFFDTTDEAWVIVPLASKSRTSRAHRGTRSPAKDSAWIGWF